VHVTRDGGGTWTDVTANVPGLPERTYVSRVLASGFDEGPVYAPFDGHRNDDFAAYAYASDDYGASWRPITTGLPATSVNIIAEHTRTADLLFLGNEVGVFVSIDGGDQWARLQGDLPTVPVDDIKVHPRDNDLVIGTHGRGIWILSDITPLEQMGTAVVAGAPHLFPVRQATSYTSYNPQGWTPSEYEAENPPYGALIRYYLAESLTSSQPAVADEEEDASAENGGGENGNGGRGRGAQANGGDKVELSIVDVDGKVVRELEGPGTAGVQQVVWDLRIEPPYVREPGQGGGGRGGGGRFGFGAPRGPRVLPGTYTVRMEAAGQTLEAPVSVRLDPRVEISNADLAARQAALMSAYELAKPVYDAQQAVRRLTSQLDDVSSLLGETEGAPEDLVAEVDSMKKDVEALGEEINDAAGGARGSFAIEGSTTRPTADQLWQLDQTWEKVPPLIERLNEFVTERMPAINSQLDEHGIRPDPGAAVDVPRRSGG